MTRERLQLALERLGPEDWAKFEQFASAFLVSDFESLRTTAAPSGDEGRDAQLYSPSDEPSVVLQYSITQDWRSKIWKTCKRISDTLPRSSILIYVTNQVIGPQFDDLRTKLRKDFAISVDVRDRSWFLDRCVGDRKQEAASEVLAKAIVDPLLSEAGVHASPSALSQPEMIAAFTYLKLQWNDDIRDKGLTKLSFEALVRAVLASTTTSKRLSRSEIKKAIHGLLPGHREEQVNTYIDSALKRLSKKLIKHWPSDDSFHLTHDETLRLNDYLTQSLLAEEMVKSDIQAIISDVLPPLGPADPLRAHVADVARRSIEQFIFEKSQAFALAVKTGRLKPLMDENLKTCVTKELSRISLPKLSTFDWVRDVYKIAAEILMSDSVAVQRHLRSLADGYTLFAFLKQTPDVQSAVEKMFSHGLIWLDTTLILPLFAESLADEEGRFTRIIKAATQAGLELFVTDGVLQEIERHMNRSLTCARLVHQAWIGGIPFLYDRYIASGRSSTSFAGWLGTFRGEMRPADDLAQYLEETFEIKRRNLLDESNQSSEEIRYALQTIWYEVHRRRREKSATPIDEMTITRLVQHDVESYCGVVSLRNKEKTSHFGYSAWWLTLDHAAFEVQDKLRDAMQAKPPDSPVMSADFLVNYLAFGPVRRKVSKATESSLPVSLDTWMFNYMTRDFAEEAEKIRLELQDQPERVVRREVRDMLDQARRQLGPVAMGGLAEYENW